MHAGFREGHEFTRAVRRSKYVRALAPEVSFLHRSRVFLQRLRSHSMFGNQFFVRDFFSS
jgi:hypothetical protein